MSKKNEHRHKIMVQVENERITLKKAAEAMAVSYRHRVPRYASLNRATVKFVCCIKAVSYASMKLMGMETRLRGRHERRARLYALPRYARSCIQPRKGTFLLCERRGHFYFGLTMDLCVI